MVNRRRDKCSLVILIVLVGRACLGQVSAPQAMSRASSYQGLSDRELAIVTAYSAAYLIGLGALTPAQVLVNAASYQGLDDRSLKIVEAYGMANALTSPSTNQFVTTNALSLTNVSYFGYGTVISNGVASTGAGGGNFDGIGLQPFGGNYYGLTITNSFLISQTNNQVGLGFPNGPAFNLPTNVPFNFYDFRVYGGSSNGIALNWSEGTAAPTNEINFFNSQFSSGHYAVNQIGSRSTFHFNNCIFEGNGPGGSDCISVGLLLDQGPVTNYISGGRIVAKNSDLNLGLLIEVGSYNFLNGVVFDISNTNTSATTTNSSSAAFGYPNHQLQNVAIGWSGEGNYVLVCNGCTFKFSGRGTNYVTDFETVQVPGGPSCTLVLNDCYWYGATGPVVVQNSIAETGGTQPTIIVSGGNFTPANFSTMAGVTFTNYSPVTNFNVASAGTIYTMTASAALLDFGTTDPSITVNQAGTYLLTAGASFETRGATYAATNAVTLKLRRTNNTAADVTGASTTCLVPIMTTISGPLNDVMIPPVVYTAASGDIIQAWGLVQATPSAGSVACDSAWVNAIRLY